MKPPKKFIHDTWLAVLGITNDMLAIPLEDLDAYAVYLDVMELIFACKEAADECISPDVWQGIEDRFLNVDAADLIE